MATMRMLGGLLAVMAMFALPSSAGAAADRALALDAAAPQTTWEGVGTGVFTPGSGPAAREPFPRCMDTAYACDHTFLDVRAPGTLAVSLEWDDPAESGFPSLLLCIYHADAAGDPGESVDDTCVTTAPGFGGGNLDKSVKVQPGGYVVEVRFRYAVETRYQGTARLRTPTVTVPVAVAPGPQPAEPAAPKRAKSCKAKAKRIKNSKKRKRALRRCRKRR